MFRSLTTREVNWKDSLIRDKAIGSSASLLCVLWILFCHCNNYALLLDRHGLNWIEKIGPTSWKLLIMSAKIREKNLFWIAPWRNLLDIFLNNNSKGRLQPRLECLQTLFPITIVMVETVDFVVIWVHFKCHRTRTFLKKLIYFSMT